eukprot:CAMPEP_0117033418 /NCGR_PEP_ID=MMETSP0472-20121206/23874_1 /TAXON_ID=693140 ORGANISM="Tiarina fusus, Strain LIS" /NCGR_SAMPLE_ID=MMETSP0472 /ASSEMBLY_ACC=CAM_ASM_000603 /LENGTH=44 /DNA_ID= /DNA_START= /DNA_END= /DNA_ORIENTATION=
MLLMVTLIPMDIPMLLMVMKKKLDMATPTRMVILTRQTIMRMKI